LEEFYHAACINLRSIREQEELKAYAQNLLTTESTEFTEKIKRKTP